jgi:hypothetical protein
VPGPLTREHLRGAWPALVGLVRSRSQMLAAVLADVEVAAVDGDTVVLRVDPLHRGALERQRDVLTQVLRQFVAGNPPLRLALEGGGAGGPPPPRLTEDSAKVERLKVLRAKDATLSAAVDALDLELLE